MLLALIYEGNLTCPLILNGESFALVPYSNYRKYSQFRSNLLLHYMHHCIATKRMPNWMGLTIALKVMVLPFCTYLLYVQLDLIWPFSFAMGIGDNKL